MKVLITGASGQLGQELVREFNKGFQTLSTTTSELDVANQPQVREIITRAKPDVIINSAAYTDVEGCAKNPSKANLINGEGTKNLAEAADQVGAKLVYISTNEVFDGYSLKPYTEEDKVNPINAYGKSKLLGEDYCRKILTGSCLIIRTSWLYGPGSTVNFPNKIIKKAKETGKLLVVDDEVATPTYAPDLAVWVLQLVSKGQSGLFHLVNDGSASRYDWAVQIMADLNLKVPIARAKLADYQRLSNPPKHSVLANDKAKKTGISFRKWEAASKEYVELLKNT